MKYSNNPLIADVVAAAPTPAATSGRHHLSPPAIRGESFAVQRNHAVFADSPLPTLTLIAAARRSARKCQDDGATDLGP